MSTALGGVLAYVYEARFGRLGLAVALMSGALLLGTTALRAPLLVPVAVLGLCCTALARSLDRTRARQPLTWSDPSGPRNWPDAGSGAY